MKKKKYLSINCVCQKFRTHFRWCFFFFLFLFLFFFRFPLLICYHRITRPSSSPSERVCSWEGEWHWHPLIPCSIGETVCMAEIQQSTQQRESTYLLIDVIMFVYRIHDTPQYSTVHTWQQCLHIYTVYFVNCNQTLLDFSLFTGLFTQHLVPACQSPLHIYITYNCIYIQLTCRQYRVSTLLTYQYHVLMDGWMDVYRVYIYVYINICTLHIIYYYYYYYY